MSDPSQPIDPPEPEANQNEDPSATTTAAAASTDQPDEPEPGIRARAFREVLKRALNQTLKGCTFENVAQCFPTAAKSRPAVLKDVHKQLIGQYEKQSEVGACFFFIFLSFLIMGAGIQCGERKQIELL